MIQQLKLLSLVLLCAAALPTQGAAQQGAGWFTEASVGVTRGNGGAFYGRIGASLDALFGRGLAEAGSGAWIVAVSTALDGVAPRGWICVLGPDGECLPDVPVFLSLGTLVGMGQDFSSGASRRVLVGPAYYHDTEEGRRAFGVQGRVDVATSPVWRTALVASFRAGILPDFQDDLLALTSFGIGLRVR